MPKKGKSSKEEEVAAAAESSDDEPPPPKKKASMAAALMDSDDDEKSDDSSKKKKKKEKKDDKDKKDKKEKKDKKKKREPEPLVCEVLKVESIPKRNNLKLCSLEVPPFGTVSVVTNAPNVVVGKKFVVALPGVTTKNGIEVTESKVGGKDSIGMLCGPNELGWATDVLDEKLAVQLDDGVEAGTSIPSYEDAVAAFKARASPAAAAAPPKEEAAGGAKEDDDDAKGGAKKGKKKKKGGAKEDDDEDFDALLAEVAAKEKPKEEPKEPEKQKEEPKEEPEKQKEEPKEEPPETAAASAKAAANKKKKDKKKGGKADDDDDFDAALNDAKEAGGNATAAEPESVKATQADLEAPAGDAKDEVVDAKTLANRAKKLKDKLKKQKQGGFDMFANDEEKKEDDDAPAKEAAPAAAAKPEPKAKGKAGAKSGVKESAIVKAARERLEEEQKFAEEKAAFDAAEKFRISEEEREEREEEEAKEAERQRKRDKKAEKLAKQKADGSFQTKAEKLRAQRAEELRKMFGLGDDKDDDDANDGAAAKADKKPEEKKKVMASKLKKKPKKQDDEADDEAKEEERIRKLDESKAQKKQAKTAAAEEDGEDWEVLDEKVEAEKQKKEAEAAAKKAAKEAAKDDSDEESGSDSDESGSGSDSDSDSSDDIEYRSPIICIMGHVDTGKTKLLDKIRKTNVQEGEAGGITQQIGATFFPDINLLEQTKKVDPDFDLEVPGLLIIDTPGHESFNNLRTRGASLCDMAILVVDIMHGLEPQTVESLELLKKRRCPFIIAMNKIDVCYQWSAKPGTCVREALDRQEQFVRDEFDKRFQSVMLQLNERGLNCALYWENDDPKSTVSIVPTSALTGEGVPDLLYCLIDLTQRLLSSQIEASDEFECTVIEVKNIEGLGTTIDVILKNGALHEGDQIVIAGIMGPIVTTIRALVTPHPMKEMRVKNDYVHHKMIDKSMGVKICAVDLEQAVAGTALLILGPDDDVEELKEEVMEEFDSILNGFQKQTEGVYVKASTLGSLEALLSFLETDMKIPVFDVGIGEVHKKDVKKALVMKEKSHPEYAVILAFDVAVNKEAKIQADKDDVQIMTADIIYHLQEKFKTYMDKVNESKKTQSRAEVVFPCMLQIDKGCVFRKKDPLIVGCDILGGQLRVGTLLCVPEKDAIEIGRVGSIEKDHKPVQVARRGERVCVKIEQNTAQSHITIGRHFEVSNQIYSKITRESIDTLKENFRDEMQKEDWELVKGMKQVFNIQ